MYLICFGTRPEIIKLIPIINKFKEKKINFVTLFSGQHENLIKDFYKYIDEPDYILENIMEHNQTLNKLISKILINMDRILTNSNISKIIVQGDTSTAYAVALSGFHHKKMVYHLEAGLRTNDKYSPYPEELNRRMISQIADVHLCPTKKSIDNLKNENIENNVYLVGNTIVDAYEYILKTESKNEYIKNLLKNSYFVVTLHRRENRGERMSKMWSELIEISDTYNIVYITHPSLPESREIFKNKKIELLEPLNYEDMVHLISKSAGIITDSGGLQEEAVCANKKVLICRDTTERPETIDCGLGKLVDTNIKENINFLLESKIIVENPYGVNVCDKIMNIL
tara:strand:- start:19020 stop:20042 length:1023 start_codon:yes stop_codon:yes gene_type:complete